MSGKTGKALSVPISMCLNRKEESSSVLAFILFAKATLSSKGYRILQSTSPNDILLPVIIKFPKVNSFVSDTVKLDFAALVLNQEAMLNNVEAIFINISLLPVISLLVPSSQTKPNEVDQRLI